MPIGEKVVSKRLKLRSFESLGNWSAIFGRFRLVVLLHIVYHECQKQGKYDIFDNFVVNLRKFSNMMSILK